MVTEEVSLSVRDHDVVRQWMGANGIDPHAPLTQQAGRDLRARLDGLPASLREALTRFGAPTDVTGVLHFRGLPIGDRLPPTPTVPPSALKVTTGTESFLLAISLCLGHALSFTNMRQGRRVHDVYPVQTDEETQKASNSVHLRMHTEMAFQQGSPDALVLLCLRAGESPPATQLCDLRLIWPSLGPEQRSLLMEPAFGFSRSADLQNPADIVRPQPVATESSAGLCFRCDGAARGGTDRHEAALMAFRNAIGRRAEELTLAAGELLVIDNRRIAHGRSPYTPRYDGGDRWLQRCLIALHADEPPGPLH